MIQKNSNLNTVTIPNESVLPSPLEDFSITKENTEIYFRNIKNKLIEKIRSADVIVGCVAWLTDYDILNELAKKEFVSIIVQKEDFLRPDFGIKSRSAFRETLRAKYENIPSGIFRTEFVKNLLCAVSYCNGDPIQSIRCVGNYNEDKQSAFPRMHNKFLVFCKRDKFKINSNFIVDMLVPLSIWTGSFNFTKNAGNSFENALYIKDSEISSAYLNEYSQICALSEPLDWAHKWVAPEWRIGS